MSDPALWIVSPAVHLEGGTERVVLECVRRWCGRFDVSLYTMETRGVDLGGCRVRRIWRPPGPHIIRFLWWMAAQRLMRGWDALRRGTPAVVHSPGVNTGDAMAIGVHMVFAKYRERVLEPARRRGFGVRGLRAVHRSAWIALVTALERRLYSGPCTLWAFSADDAAFLEWRFNRPKGSVPVIPHGVDADHFSPSRREAARPRARSRLVSEDGPVLLLLGNDGYKKGLDTAIRALALLPADVSLIAVGDDAIAPFRRLARALGLASRVRFMRGGPDVLDWYAAADVLVAPSRDDAFHLPALEAMACGLPVVLSARAGASELVRDGEEALILEDPENERALAGAVERVLREPAASGRRLAAARALAERMTWDRAAAQTAALLDREVTTPRILVLAADAFGIGGIEQATRTLLRVLTDRYGRERIGLLSLRGPVDGAGTIDCRIVYSGPAGSGRSARVRLASKLGFSASAVRAARRWGGGRLVILATHAHLAPVARACAAATHSRYAVWAHGQEVWGPLRPTVRHALAHADAIFTPSEFTAARLADAMPARRASVEVIRHAVTTGPIAGNPQREVGLVLAVARLDAADRYKGVDTLIRAWPLVLQQVPEARLDVIGDGDDRKELERIAVGLAVDGRIRFCGALPDPERDRAYHAASVFALPGRCVDGAVPRGEGFGLVFLEAAAAGLPCIAGAAGGAAEAVENGVTGFVVDPLDAGAIADSIVRLLRDPDLARQLGEAGRRRVAAGFGAAQFAASVTGLVDGLASSGGRS